MEFCAYNKKSMVDSNNKTHAYYPLFCKNSYYNKQK